MGDHLSVEKLLEINESSLHTQKNGLLKLNRLLYFSAIYWMLIDFCYLLLNRIFLREVGFFTKKLSIHF